MGMVNHCCMASRLLVAECDLSVCFRSCHVPISAMMCNTCFWALNAIVWLPQLPAAGHMLNCLMLQVAYKCNTMKRAATPASDFAVMTVLFLDFSPDESGLRKSQPYEGFARKAASSLSSSCQGLAACHRHNLCKTVSSGNPQIYTISPGNCWSLLDLMNDR